MWIPNVLSWLCGRDEELLARGLELNDGLQSLLAKHDAIASGSTMPIEVTSVSSKPTEASTSNKSNEVKNSSPAPNISPPAPIATVTRSQIDEDEEEEDDFAQLARRFHMLTSNSFYITCHNPRNDKFYVGVYRLVVRQNRTRENQSINHIP